MLSFALLFTGAIQNEWNIKKKNVVNLIYPWFPETFSSRIFIPDWDREGKGHNNQKCILSFGVYHGMSILASEVWRYDGYCFLFVVGFFLFVLFKVSEYVSNVTLIHIWYFSLACPYIKPYRHSEK